MGVEARPYMRRSPSADGRCCGDHNSYSWGFAESDAEVLLRVARQNISCQLAARPKTGTLVGRRSRQNLQHGGYGEERGNRGEGTAGFRLPASSKSNRKDIVNLAVKENGDYLIDKTRVSSVELRNYLSNQFRTNINMAVYITGDADATHGMIIDALDLVRQEGIQKVSFAIPGAPQASTKQ